MGRIITPFQALCKRLAASAQSLVPTERTFVDTLCTYAGNLDPLTGAACLHGGKIFGLEYDAEIGVFRVVVVQVNDENGEEEVQYGKGPPSMLRSVEDRLAILNLNGTLTETQRTTMARLWLGFSPRFVVMDETLVLVYISNDRCSVVRVFYLPDGTRHARVNPLHGQIGRSVGVCTKDNSLHVATSNGRIVCINAETNESREHLVIEIEQSSERVSVADFFRGRYACMLFESNLIAVADTHTGAWHLSRLRFTGIKVLDVVAQRGSTDPMLSPLIVFRHETKGKFNAAVFDGVNVLDLGVECLSGNKADMASAAIMDTSVGDQVLILVSREGYNKFPIENGIVQPCVSVLFEEQDQQEQEQDIIDAGVVTNVIPLLVSKNGFYVQNEYKFTFNDF